MKEWILSSSVITVAVILFRALLKRHISARIRYALWLPVLLRLLIPFSFGSSPVSVQNAIPVRAVVQSESEEGMFSPEASKEMARVDLESGTADKAVSFSADHLASGSPMWSRINFFGIWLAVASCFLVAITISHLCYLRKLRISRYPLQEADILLPVFIVKWITAPFLAGIIHPAIYLSDGLSDYPERLRHVLVHEETHYKHGDHIWSWLRMVALALHWYNPLVWFAAILSKHDAELACDEAALLSLGDQERKKYGETLLALTTPQFSWLFNMSTAMTESKRSLQERICHIVVKPKTARSILAIVLIFSLFSIFATFTGRAESGQDIYLAANLKSEDGTVNARINLTSPALFSKEKQPVVNLEYHTISALERERIVSGLFGSDTPVYMDLEGTDEDWAWGAVGTKEFYDRWIEDAKWAQNSEFLERIIGNDSFYDHILSQISEFLEKYDHTQKYEAAPNNADLQPLFWNEGSQRALIESSGEWYRVGVTVDPTPGRNRSTLYIVAAETDAYGLYSVVLHKDYCSETITRKQLDEATAKVESLLKPMGLTEWEIQSTEIMDHTTGSAKQLSILVTLEHRHVSDLQRCESVYRIINADDSICIELSADGKLFRMDYTCPLGESIRTEEEICSDEELVRAIESCLMKSTAKEYVPAAFSGNQGDIAQANISVTALKPGMVYIGNSYSTPDQNVTLQMIPAVTVYGTVAFTDLNGEKITSGDEELLSYQKESRPIFIINALDGKILQNDFYR